MKHTATSPNKAGFLSRRSEVVISIVLILIVAAISVCVFIFNQRQTISNSLKYDLVTTEKTLIAHRSLTTGAYPNTLPSSIQAPKNTLLRYTYIPRKTYTSLTDGQNASLFADICKSIIDQGLGEGKDASGATIAYVTGCGNETATSIQINGWITKSFSTPISLETIAMYADKLPDGDSYHPAERMTIQNFYDILITRFVAQGGHFPITTFWDTWATKTNGGVVQEQLNGISSATISGSYCLQLTSATYSDLIFHVTAGTTPQKGKC